MVLTPLRLDAEAVQLGTEVELDAAEAARLAEVGAVRLLGAALVAAPVPKPRRAAPRE